jgi:hypothetical protein
MALRVWALPHRRGIGVVGTLEDRAALFDPMQLGDLLVKLFCDARLIGK